MPRNPANKRAEILLSPEEYTALKDFAARREWTIGEAIRQALIKVSEDFAVAQHLRGRGQYERTPEYKLRRDMIEGMRDAYVEFFRMSPADVEGTIEALFQWAERRGMARDDYEKLSAVNWMAVLSSDFEDEE